MLESILWFTGQALFSLFMLFVGRYLGRRGGRAIALTMLTCMFLLLGWSLRALEPTLYFNILPLNLLVYVEGTGNVPIFMLFIGVIWTQQKDLRARRTALPMFILAVLYFLWNGMWMIMPYPTGKESITEPEGGMGSHGAVVFQYSEESCVAAAAATAMLAPGINKPISEADMIRLTETRSTRGSTAIRALYGLRKFLKGSGIEAGLVNINADGAANMASLDLPVLAPVHSGIAMEHMVVIYGHPPRLTDVFDPDREKHIIDWIRKGDGDDPPLPADAADDAEADPGSADVARGTEKNSGPEQGGKTPVYVHIDSRTPGGNRLDGPSGQPLFQLAVRRFYAHPKDMRDYVIIGNPTPARSEILVNVPRGIQVISMATFRRIYAGPAIFFYHKPLDHEAEQ